MRETFPPLPNTSSLRVAHVQGTCVQELREVVAHLYYYHHYRHYHHHSCLVNINSHWISMFSAVNLVFTPGDKFEHSIPVLYTS